jgi:hypothetical protein
MRKDWDEADCQGGHDDVVAKGKGFLEACVSH